MKTEWTFPSSSSAAIYTAKVGGDGRLMCNCPGWVNKRGENARHCKHTKLIVAELKATAVPRGEYTYLAGMGNSKWVGDRAPQAPAPKAREAQERVSPMLASAMVDPVKGAAFNARFNYNVWAMEEKLDGHRVVAVVDKFPDGRWGRVQAHSRPRAGDTARARELPDHIVEQLANLPNGTYDGELLAASGKAWDVTTGGSNMVYVIFDMLEFASGDMKPQSYAQRREFLLGCLSKLPKGQKAITSVLSLDPTWAAVEAIWKRGGEGAILKRRDSPYRPGHRSPDWIKVKRIASATLKITGFTAGKSGPYSVTNLVDREGNETTVKTIDNATMRAIAKDPQAWIGKRLVVSYQERLPGGSYRHIMWDHIAGKGENGW